MDKPEMDSSGIKGERKGTERNLRLGEETKPPRVARGRGGGGGSCAAGVGRGGGAGGGGGRGRPFGRRRAAGHGRGVGRGRRPGPAAAAAADGAVGGRRGAGAGLRADARAGAAGRGASGAGAAPAAGRLPAAQRAGQRGPLPAPGPGHRRRGAGGPGAGPRLGLLLPVPESGPPAQQALPGLQGLRPAPGPPLPAAGALRGLQQLPALPVPAAPRGRPAAARHGPAGPGPGPPAAGALPAARRDVAAAALAHAAHRWRVPGPVRSGLHSRHVRGGRPALRGRAPLPRDAAAARPNHPRVGPRAASLRPGPPAEHGGRPGLPLAPGVALALPVLPAARGWHHLPDRRLRSVARGEHGLGAEERRGPLPARLSSPGLRPHQAGPSPPPSCLALKPRIRSFLTLPLPPRPGPGRAVGPSPGYNKALKLLLPLCGGRLWGRDRGGYLGAWPGGGECPERQGGEAFPGSPFTGEEMGSERSGAGSASWWGGGGAHPRTSLVCGCLPHLASVPFVAPPSVWWQGQGALCGDGGRQVGAPQVGSLTLLGGLSSLLGPWPRPLTDS